MKVAAKPDGQRKSLYRNLVLPSIACTGLFLAAASIQQSMIISGEVMARSVGARSTHLKERAAAAQARIRKLESGDAGGLDLVTAYLTYSDFLYQDQRLEPALSAMKQALKLRETVKPDSRLSKSDAPSVVDILLKLAEIERARGDFNQAEAYINRAISLDSNTDGAVSCDLLRDLNVLGTIKIASGMTVKDPGLRETKLEEGFRLLEKSEADIRKIPDTVAKRRDNLLCVNLQNQAFVLRELGWASDSKQKESEAQTLRSALR